MITEPPAVNGRRTTRAGRDARERLLAGLPVQERTLRLAGIDTAVLEGGAGPPLVLLHGPGEFAAKWLRVLPDLVTRHRVVAPDLPGHGRSALGDGELDADRVLRWLDELIDATCAEPPALVGHVLGGAIAARFAARHSARIERLVLVDSLGLGRFRPAPGFGLALLRFNVRPTERTYDGLWRRCSFDLDALRAQMGDEWTAFSEYNLELARTSSGRAAVRALMSGVGVPAIPAADLERISVPTALIWGRHDEANRLRVAQAASARYGWPLHVVEDAADDPILDQPVAFLQALDAALDAGREVVA